LREELGLDSGCVGRGCETHVLQVLEQLEVMLVDEAVEALRLCEHVGPKFRHLLDGLRKNGIR
jgi:hypothetical protein